MLYVCLGTRAWCFAWLLLSLHPTDFYVARVCVEENCLNFKKLCSTIEIYEKKLTWSQLCAQYVHTLKRPMPQKHIWGRITMALYPDPIIVRLVSVQCKRATRNTLQSADSCAALLLHLTPCLLKCVLSVGLFLWPKCIILQHVPWTIRMHSQSDPHFLLAYEKTLFNAFKTNLLPCAQTMLWHPSWKGSSDL